jgi:carbon-monoxide dehydrogenase large subunit
MQVAGIPALALDRVRYVGEPVALVVADDLGTAVSAAESVILDLEPLDAVVTPEQALAAAAPSLHGRSNLVLDWEDGDAQAAEQVFASAHHVEHVELREPPLTPSAMEPRAAIAAWDAQSGRYSLVASTQGVMVVRKQLAEGFLKVPLEQLRVLTPQVGGGFGGKVQTYPEYAALLHAAKVAGRPVRWTATRLECFLTDTHARNSVLKARMAFDAEGRVLGIDVDVTFGIGAYTSTYIAIVCTNNVKNCLSSVYRIPGIHIRSRLAFTNSMPHGPYRGAGRPEAIYMIERLLDAASAPLGIDRVELRRRNLIPSSAMPYRAANGQVYDSGEFEAVLDKALALSDWNGFEARRREAAARGKLRGIGVCCFLEVAGGILEEPAELQFNADRTVDLHIGAQAIGQGHQATLPRLVAQRLGIAPAHVRLVAGDSDRVPGLVATVASRSMMMGGSASALACDDAIARGKLIAAQLLEASPHDIGFADGSFRVVGTDRALHILDIPARLQSGVRLPEGVPQTLDNTARFTSSGMSFPNGCHVCEVEIDPDTGVARVVQHTAVDDVGVVLNPAVVEGQVLGGVAQGLGQVFGEGLHYDASGQLLTASYMDYYIPRADDLPHVRTAHHAVPCTTNPLGVKGAGESGVAGSLPSAINAVLHALSSRGVRRLEPPFTSAKVWEALNQGSGSD